MRASRVLSRVTALALLAVFGAAGLVVGVVAPSGAATPEDAIFDCKDASGAGGYAEFSVGYPYQVGDDSPRGDLSVSFNDGDSWELRISDWGVPSPFSAFLDYVHVGGDTSKTHPYLLRWVTPDHTYMCSGMFYPIAIDAHPKLRVTRGDSVSILASLSGNHYPDLSRLSMVAYLQVAGAWKAIASGRVSALSGASLVTFDPPHSGDVQVRIFDDRKDPGHTKPIGKQDLGFLIVDQPTPYVVAPGTVYAGQVATLRAWYGTGEKAYAAILERWSGSEWVPVDDGNTSADGEAVLQWRPTATAKYRIQFWGDDSRGISKLNRTHYFTYSPSYKVTVTAAKSVKKGTMATFTVSHKLAIPFYAYLQNWRGGKWVTVKKFVPGDQATKVTAKITATGKWRVTAAGYVSKTITVSAK